jgi:hypothetical protein
MFSQPAMYRATQTVVKITGNYFAAYPGERMTREERARQTYRDVMLPILQAAAPAFALADVLDAFALEISHHVIRKVSGVDTESPESVVLILPKASAKRLVEARDEVGRSAAVLEGTAYINGAPVSFWPRELNTSPVIRVSTASIPPVVAAPAVPAIAVAPPVVTVPPVPAAPQITSSVGNLDTQYRDTFAGMLNELDSQAHFVPYAPPSFITFRGGQYLQVPITMTLAASDAGSQYKLATLAFDRHVVHLIRPVLARFKDSSDFTRIDFSTSVRLAGVNAEGEGGTAVELIFPLSALRRYEQFDLTGQQLLHASVLLINGERAGLDLQTAEAFIRSPN